MPYILVVEDDADQRELLTRILNNAGYEVGSVIDGREALSSIAIHTPELLILDLSMPDLDGPGLLELVRSHLRLHTLPVVVITGFGESPMLERARQLNVNAILTKGRTTPEEIVRVVKSALAEMPIEPIA